MIKPNPQVSGPWFPWSCEKAVTIVQRPATTSQFAMAEKEMIREGMLLITKIPKEPRATKLEMIVEKLSDPDFDAHEIQRYISFEMAAVIRETLAGDNDRAPVEQARLSRQRLRLLKALRDLSKQTREASLARKREDTLDLHGRKFQFVLGEIFKHFNAAMKDVKIDDHQRQNTMRHLRDILSINEEGLIRELKQMDRQPS